jgi:hypothetical protein
MSAIMPVTVLLSFRLILILQTIFAKGANLLFKNTDHINNGIKSAIIAYLVFHTFLKFKGEPRLRDSSGCMIPDSSLTKESNPDQDYSVLSEDFLVIQATIELYHIIEIVTTGNIRSKKHVCSIED